MASNTEELKVSKVISKDVISTFVIGFCQSLSWGPGKMDDELYWTIVGPGTFEKAGIYVGTLNDVNTTCVGVMQHSEQFAFLSLYYCEEEHRGKGYGWKTWRTALDAVDTKVNVCLDGVLSKVHLYEKEGFKKASAISFHGYSASSVLEAYKNIAAPDGVSIKPATEVDFSKLKLYIEDVIGISFSRPDFLQKMISLPTHTALAATNNNGDIVGIAIMREAINFESDGYIVCPLIADDGALARLLLLKFAQSVNAADNFTIFFSYAFNEEIFNIVEEIKAKKGLEVVRMYTAGEPPIKKEKYFGLIIQL